MQEFEPKAVLTDNIWGYLWGKLIYGALLFATALTNDSIADVLADRRYRPVLIGAGARSRARSPRRTASRPRPSTASIPSAFAPGCRAAATDASFDDMVAHNRRSAKSHSGIWRDLAIRKRKTEVDAQILPIVEIGRKLGVATPLTARTVAMIHEIEDGKRPLALANLDELTASMSSTSAAAK